MLSIEKIKPHKTEKGKWRFTVAFHSPVGCMHSHGWRYVEKSDRIMRPTAAGFQGPLTNLDEDHIDLLRRLLKDELRLRSRPVGVKAVLAELKKQYAERKNWGEVYEVFRQDLERYAANGNAFNSTQLFALISAACLAEVEAEDLPDNVSV